MVDAIVSYAIEKLGDFVIKKATFLGEVRGEVEWLKNELEATKAFLRDAENKKGADHRVRWWVSEIENICHEAVTIVENLDVKVEGRGESQTGFMASLQSCVCCCREQADLYDIGKEIEPLKKRVLDIAQKRITYGIADLNPSGERTSVTSQPFDRPARIRRTTSSFARDDSLIGFEDVLTDVKAKLSKAGASRSVVSIVGTGGLGKTTIASKLYHSFTDFGRKGWVSVSQEYNTQDLLQRIIKSFQEKLTGEDLKLLKNMIEEDLERHLRKILEGQRYLLVIDDVWSSEAWESLKRALPDNKNRSRVILTTRNKNVAIQASGEKSIHELRFLTKEESWDLFQEKLYHEGDSEPDHCSPAMKNLANEMVGKCKGLPLAIIVLAGILSHKSGLDEWQKVKKHIWQQLKKDRVEISELFTLSFNDMSPGLQKCFLYTGMFPEDYVIDVRKLIRLWIAEELLPQLEERKEDLAAEFFNELINRSLIQEAGRFWEEIVKCRVHDLLRDLAIQKAKELQFFDIYDPHKNSSNSILCKRHAIHGSIQKYMSVRHSNMKLQTLLFFKQDQEKMGLNEVLLECLKFKSLGVLDLERIDMLSEDLPDGLGDLIHLKFLGLSETYVVNIPSSIGNLKYLQTLEVQSYRNSCTLPIEICELKELRHLYGLFDKGSISFKNRSQLLTLGAVKYSEEFEASTVYLSNLQELSICYPSSLAFISHLQNLATLIIVFETNNDLLVPLEPLASCKSLNKLWVGGKLQKLPTSNEFPPSLTRLILFTSKLLGDPMPILEKLPNLRSLELINAYRGKKMVCSAGGFPQLEVLRLRSLNELEEWKVDEGAMPKTRGMRIVLCEKLKEVPKRLMSVPRVPKTERIYCVPSYVDLDL